MNKHIILLFIILCIGLTKASAQHSITGKVLDATNQEPIPFASVTIKNVKSGTTTDNNGNFTLTSVLWDTKLKRLTLEHKRK